MSEKAVMGNGHPWLSYECRDAWVGRVLFTALKDMNKPIALFGSVWEGRNIGYKSICTGIQEYDMEFVQSNQGILRCGGREHLDMGPIIFFQGVLKMKFRIRIWESNGFCINWVQPKNGAVGVISEPIGTFSWILVNFEE
jgi:hypothetical protein